MVPDVKVKTTASSLIEVAGAFNNAIRTMSPPADTVEKRCVSLWTEFRHKLMQKASSKLDEKKEFNYKLKYWFAFEMHLVLKSSIISPETQKLFDQLDQKLA